MTSASNTLGTLDFATYIIYSDSFLFLFLLFGLKDEPMFSLCSMMFLLISLRSFEDHVQTFLLLWRNWMRFFFSWAESVFSIVIFFYLMDLMILFWLVQILLAMPSHYWFHFYYLRLKLLAYARFLSCEGIFFNVSCFSLIVDVRIN